MRKLNFRITRKRKLKLIKSLSVKSQLIYKIKCREVVCAVNYLSPNDIEIIQKRLRDHDPIETIMKDIYYPPLPIDIIDITDSDSDSDVWCETPEPVEKNPSDVPINLVEDGDSDDQDIIEIDDDSPAIPQQRISEPENEDPFKLISKLLNNGIQCSIVPKRRCFGTQLNDLSTVVCID